MPLGPVDELSALRGPRVWAGAEYLLFWTEEAPISVPIATGGPAAGFGVLGAPGTVVRLGNSDVDFREQHGIRVVGGGWITDSLGIEASGFILPTKTQRIGPIGPTEQFPTLARPFADANLRGQNVRLLSRPATFEGSIGAQAQMSLWGAEVAPVLRVLDRGGRVTLDGMVGFKHVSLEESLDISDSARALAGGVANFNGVAFRTGATTSSTDHFYTANRIYAAMLGGRVNLHLQAFTLSLAGKISLGTNEQTVAADGSTTLVGPFPSPTVVGGGLYAVGPIVGRRTNSEFVAVPELNLNLTCQVTTHLTVSFGYNVLYISDVVRPGDQLGSAINPAFVPTSSNFGSRIGSALPQVPFKQSDFWANGLNLGLTVGF
jgi:hypothetical protein